MSKVTTIAQEAWNTERQNLWRGVANVPPSAAGKYGALFSSTEERIKEIVHMAWKARAAEIEQAKLEEAKRVQAVQAQALKEAAAAVPPAPVASSAKTKADQAASSPSAAKDQTSALNSSGGGGQAHGPGQGQAIGEEGGGGPKNGPGNGWLRQIPIWLLWLLLLLLLIILILLVWTLLRSRSRMSGLRIPVRNMELLKNAIAASTDLTPDKASTERETVYRVGVLRFILVGSEPPPGHRHHAA